MINFIKSLSTKKKILYSCLIVLAILFIVYAIISLTYKYNGTEHVVPKALNPVFISFGDKLEIRWYAIFVVGGAGLLSFYGYFRYLKPANFNSDQTLTGVTLGIIFGVLGGRLYYVFFNHDFISFEDGIFKGIIQIINPATGGLAIHGALYATIIYIVVYTRIKHFKLLETIEIVLPVFMLAQVVGRWGNFFNQEAYGPLVNGYTQGPLTDAQLIAQRETLRHLLVPNFVINNMYMTSGVSIVGYYHPTFFYEGCANLIFAVTYIEIRKYSKKIYIGDGIPFYLFCYGLVRFFIELLRQDPLTFELFGHTFKTAIVTSVIFMVVGVLLFILRRVFKFYLVPANSFLYGKGSIWKDGYYNGKKIEDLEKEEKEKKHNPLDEIPIKKLVIIDCDGTILNTYKMIEKVTMQVFDELIPDYKYTMDEIHAFFGPLINESFKKYVSEEELPKVVNRYIELCALYQKDYVKPFPGIVDTLKELKEKGYKIVILSNKVTSTVVEELESNDMVDLFDEVYGAEKVDDVKPSPLGVYKIIEESYLNKAIVVGDSLYDIKAGNNAKEGFPEIISVGVTWCKTTREEFESVNADRIIDTPNELIKVVDEYEKI